MRKFDEAFALHQQGRLPEAERAYQAILRRDGKHFEALYNLAHIYMGKANYADVVKLLRRALYQKPNSAEAHNLQGVALLKLGRYGEALPRFEKALALRRDFAEAQHNIGDALRKLDRPDEAVAHYEKALALRPDWAEAADGLGSALQELGRPEDALRHFQKAISLRPGFGGAHGNLGYVLRTLGRLEDGKAALERAIALEPRRPAFYRLLRRVQDIRGRRSACRGDGGDGGRHRRRRAGGARGAAFRAGESLSRSRRARAVVQSSDPGERAQPPGHHL